MDRNHAKEHRHLRRSDPQQLANAAAYGDAAALTRALQTCDIHASPNGMTALEFATKLAADANTK